MSVLNQMMNKIVESLKPPPDLTISEWADDFRQLSPEASSEHGRWRTSRTEYMRGIMDAVSDKHTEEVVMMSSAQVGKTELILNILGYYIHYEPCPILAIQPTIAMAETFSKDRLAPMIRDTKVITSLFSGVKARDSSNTILKKSFTGGTISMAGANSPASLASRPVRLVLFDEVDRYVATSEGDAVDLGKKRTTTFHNRKKVLVSTPTDKGSSRIEVAYEASDKRRFHVPCPHCEEKQTLKWANVKWEKDEEGKHLPKTAYYVCEENGCKITDNDIPYMLRGGEWIAEKPFNGIAGFHLNELYSPFQTFADTVQAFLDAKEAGTESLRVWVNTALGETWEDEGAVVDAHALMKRAEIYEAEVPDGVLLITCGVDVQGDRLEAEVVGWNEKHQSWNIDYRIIHGDPNKNETWEALAGLLFDEVYFDKDGKKKKIIATCIDSGGHHTKKVYDFCIKHKGKRVFAIKGRGGQGIPTISSPSRARSGRSERHAELYTLGIDAIKDITLARLMETEELAYGYCHFPHVRDDEYFAQMTAEKKIITYKFGKPTIKWIPTRKRNEAFDCRNYATAALEILNPVWRSLIKDDKITETIDNNDKISDNMTSKAIRNRVVRRNRPKKSRGML